MKIGRTSFNIKSVKDAGKKEFVKTHKVLLEKQGLDAEEVYVKLTSTRKK